MLLLQFDESDSLGIFPDRTGIVTAAASDASSVAGVYAKLN